MHSNSSTETENRLIFTGISWPEKSLKSQDPLNLLKNIGDCMRSRDGSTHSVSTPPHFRPYNTFKTKFPGNPPKSVKIRIKNGSGTTSEKTQKSRNFIIKFLTSLTILLSKTLGHQDSIFILLRQSLQGMKTLNQMFSNRGMALLNWRLCFTLQSKLRIIIVGLMGIPKLGSYVEQGAGQKHPAEQVLVLPPEKQGYIQYLSGACTSSCTCQLLVRPPVLVRCLYFLLNRDMHVYQSVACASS